MELIPINLFLFREYWHFVCVASMNNCGVILDKIGIEYVQESGKLHLHPLDFFHNSMSNAERPNQHNQMRKNHVEPYAGSATVRFHILSIGIHFHAVCISTFLPLDHSHNEQIYGIDRSLFLFSFFSPSSCFHLRN